MGIVFDEHKPRFEKLMVSFCYKPPEQIAQCFWMLSELVNDVCPISKFLKPNIWEIKMVSMLATKTEEELLQEQLEAQI